MVKFYIAQVCLPKGDTRPKSQTALQIKRWEADRMLTELKQGSKVVGVKQTKRAVNDGKAARVFLAEDADPRVTAPVEALCAEKQIPVERVPQMKELGSACGIAVPSAVAALLH